MEDLRFDKLPVLLVGLIDVVVGCLLLSVDWIYRAETFPGAVFHALPMIVGGGLALRGLRSGLVLAAGSAASVVLAIVGLIIGLAGEWSRTEGFGRLGIVVFTTLLSAGLIGFSAVLMLNMGSRMIRGGGARAKTLAVLGALVVCVGIHVARSGEPRVRVGCALGHARDCNRLTRSGH